MENKQPISQANSEIDVRDINTTIQEALDSNETENPEENIGILMIKPHVANIPMSTLIRGGQSLLFKILNEMDNVPSELTLEHAQRVWIGGLPEASGPEPPKSDGEHMDFYRAGIEDTFDANEAIPQNVQSFLLGLTKNDYEDIVQKMDIDSILEHWENVRDSESELEDPGLTIEEYAEKWLRHFNLHLIAKSEVQLEEADLQELWPQFESDITNENNWKESATKHMLSGPVTSFLVIGKGSSKIVTRIKKTVLRSPVIGSIFQMANVAHSPDPIQSQREPHIRILFTDINPEKGELLPIN